MLYMICCCMKVATLPCPSPIGYAGEFTDERKKKKGARATPLALKIMGALKIMAVGCPISSVSLECGVSNGQLNPFFHAFTNWMVATYYDKYVYLPDKDELPLCEQVYRLLGLPGCFASMDGVHLAWDNCPAPLMPLYKGKEQYPTVAHNVTSNHARRIMCVNGPYPGSKNDKTMARMDAAISKARNDNAYLEYEYPMYTSTGEGYTQKGAWILCDGGYHRWCVTICGYKTATKEGNPATYYWSKR